MSLARFCACEMRKHYYAIALLLLSLLLLLPIRFLPSAADSHFDVFPKIAGEMFTPSPTTRESARLIQSLLIFAAPLTMKPPSAPLQRRL